jgi:hypothetical protein
LRSIHTANTHLAVLLSFHCAISLGHTQSLIPHLFYLMEHSESSDPRQRSAIQQLVPTIISSRSESSSDVGSSPDVHQSPGAGPSSIHADHDPPPDANPPADTESSLNTDNATPASMEDQARRRPPTDQRGPSPTFEDVLPELPSACAWYTARDLENRRYMEEWDQVRRILDGVDDRVRAAEELRRPDLMREPETEVDDTDDRLGSLKETDTWMKEMQKKIDEQERETALLTVGRTLPRWRPTTHSGNTPVSAFPPQQVTTQSGDNPASAMPRRQSTTHGTTPVSALPQKRPRDETGPPPPARQKSIHLMHAIEQSVLSGSLRDGFRSSATAVGGELVPSGFHSANVRPRQALPTGTGRSLTFRPMVRNTAPSERQTWGLGLGRSGYEVPAKTTADTSRQQGIFGFIDNDKMQFTLDHEDTEAAMHATDQFNRLSLSPSGRPHASDDDSMLDDGLVLPGDDSVMSAEDSFSMRGRDSGTPPRGDADIPRRSLDRPSSGLVQHPGGDVGNPLGDDVGNPHAEDLTNPPRDDLANLPRNDLINPPHDNFANPPHDGLPNPSRDDLTNPPRDDLANPRERNVSNSQSDAATVTQTSTRGTSRGRATSRGRGRGSRSRSKQPLVITPLDRFVRFKDAAGNVQALPITTIPEDVAEALNDNLDEIFDAHLELACRVTKPDNQQKNVETPYCVPHLVIQKKLSGPLPDPDYKCSACSNVPRVCVRMEQHPEDASKSAILVFYPRDPSSAPPGVTSADLGYWM